MNKPSYGQKTGPDTAASGGAGRPAGEGQQAASTVNGTDAGQSAGSNQAVLGPFTVRDLTVFGATLILFVASLVPMFLERYNLWNVNNLFFLGLGIILPLVVSALFAARRLAPAVKIRIGSLSIDQFASVVASFSFAFFFLAVVADYASTLLVGLVGSVVLFAATVLGRFLPYLSADFQGRAESPAHVVAREAAVPVRKPRAAKQPKPEATAKPSAGGKLLGAARGGLFSGPGVGSSAVQPGEDDRVPARSSYQAPATAAVPTTGIAGAGAAASGGQAAGQAPAAPVSSAPETSGRAPEGDLGPVTQAADVVRPSSAPAASAPAASAPQVEDTQFGSVPAASGSGSSATGGAAAAGHYGGGAQPGASATRSTWEPPAATAVHQQIRSEEPIGATVDPSSRPEESEEQPIHEAFWFAVAQHRTAFDPRTGAPAFVIEPGGWVLALEDRGHEFLVQHTDGRLGVLRDLSNIERG